MKSIILNQINKISAKEWNSLCPYSNPFIQHEFLAALEKHHCVGEAMGWIPQHLILRSDSDDLIGAMPLYIKFNSYGEFVFDWSWADAYHRSGLNYYPKLVCSIPYTPATGPRLLVAAGEQQNNIKRQLINDALEHAKHLGVSSLHCLFPNKDEQLLIVENTAFKQRIAYQFHWQNQGYADFEEFLASLNSKKRKKIKRERRYVDESNVTIQVLHGDETTQQDWEIFHRHYTSTFDKLGGHATLSLAFFLAIAEQMPRQVILILATHEQKCVASALCFRSDDTLYGRHWGCDAEFHSLHFEACYYQGIEYCIQHGLKTFEPGAQGEHKIWRGFLPSLTYSAHWIAHPEFRNIINQFLDDESRGIEHHMQALSEHSPYRKTP